MMQERPVTSAQLRAGRALLGLSQAVLAGCTEIPLVLAADALAVPMVDSLEVLAARTVALARGAAS